MPLTRAGVGRVRSSLLLAIALAICVSGAALAQTTGQQATGQQATVLHLSQTAERKVVRDVLRVELRIEETGADPLALQAAINRRMAAALDRAHQVQGVEVETGAYAVNEEQPQNGPSRWRASQSVILTGKAEDAVLKLAGSLQSDGLLDVLARLRGLARDRARRGG